MSSGKDQYFKGVKMELAINIKSSGTVEAESREISLATWCSDIANTQNWPSDQLNCFITLGIQNSRYIQLKPDYSEFFRVELFS